MGSNVRPLSLLLAAALACAGCSPAMPPAAPTAAGAAGTPTAARTTAAGSAAASGSVVPGRQARLAFATAGQVETVLASRGDRVADGQVLARLAGSARLNAAAAAADLEALAAAQALKDLRAAAALNAAQAQLEAAAAQHALNLAEAAVTRLTTPDLTYRREQVDRAQARLTAAEQNAAVTNFEAAQRAARDAFETAANTWQTLQQLETQYPGYGQLHGDALTKAQQAYDRAAQDLQAAEFRLDQARNNDAAALADARRALGTAQANLLEAQAGPDPDALALAQAQAAVARAALDRARDRAVRAAGGGDPDQLALAQARLSTAEAQQAAAQAALADLELRAPFSGTLAEMGVTAGEWVSPGQTAALLADLDHFRVETSDLSERDVPDISVGQPAAVFVPALNQQLPAIVREIGALAETLGGDVVYRVVLDLEGRPAGLRAGMSVDVRFNPAP